MRRLRRLLGGLTALARRDRLDRDLNDELQQFFEASVAGKVAGGMPRPEAERTARLELGSPAAVKEWTRDAGWESHVENVWLDLRYATRALRRSPGFALAAIGTLAVGLGSTAATYAVVDAVLLKPMPFAQPDRVVEVRYRDAADGNYGIGAASIAAVRQLPAVESAAGAVGTERAIVSNDLALLASGEAASEEFFDVFGVEAALGRTFSATDRDAGAVVVLSDRLWRRAFGARTDVVGTSILMSGVSHRVLGVMPADFRFRPGDRSEFWVLRPFRPSELAEYGGGSFHGVARLKEANLQVARAQASSLALPPVLSSRGETLTLALVPVLDTVTEFYGRILWSLLGAVSFVLLLACGNVANLLLARGRQRGPELLIRAAIGASRGRLVRQLFTECVVIAGAAGLAGGGLAWLLVQLLPLLPLTAVNVARIDEVALNGRVVVFLLALTAGTVLLFGMIPALAAARRGQAPGSSRAVSARRGRASQVLIGLEVAATVALLAGSSLVALRISELMNADVGFDLRGLQMASLRPLGSVYEGRELTRLYTSFVERARETFGLQLALVDRVPLDFWRAPSVQITDAAGGAPKSAGLRVMAADALEVLGADLIAGRAFSAADRDGGALVALLNTSMAAHLDAAGVPPIGATLTVTRGEARDEVTVVGVVDDMRDSAYRAVGPEIYLSAAQFPPARASFVVRSDRPVEEVDAALRQALRTVDPSQALSDVVRLEERLRTYTALSRFVGILLALFATLAVGLAATGILAVAAGAVAARTREIGIRVAIGATPRDVLASLSRDFVPGVLAGGAVGVCLAASLTSVLRWLTPGVAGFHPLAYGGAIVVIAVVAGVGAWLPARRALAIAPTIALTTPEEW